VHKGLVCGVNGSGSANRENPENTDICCDDLPHYGCVQNAQVRCDGATGWTCQPGLSPTRVQADLTCDAADSTQYDYTSSLVSPFCCKSSPSNGCAPNGQVICLGGGGAGWTCPSGATPDQEEHDLSCGAPYPDPKNDGSMDFCCAIKPADPFGCTENSSVTCQTGTGWTCGGGVNPREVNSSLTCNTPQFDTANNTQSDFCCMTAPSPCDPQLSFYDCPLPGTGWHCPANPADTLPGVTCTAAGGSHGPDDFCCTL
jgi:hypothetical protein